MKDSYCSLASLTHAVKLCARANSSKGQAAPRRQTALLAVIVHVGEAGCEQQQRIKRGGSALLYGENIFI